VCCERLRFTVVQDKVHALLAVKLDVPRQVLVSAGVDAHGEARLPLLPPETERGAASRRQPEAQVDKRTSSKRSLTGTSCAETPAPSSCAALRLSSCRLLPNELKRL